MNTHKGFRPNNTNPCILLHNGARLYFFNAGGSFGGTATTNAIAFDIDPDGRVTDGTTNGPGKTAEFYLYYNGRLMDKEAAPASTASSLGIYTNNSPARVPPWLSWN